MIFVDIVDKRESGLLQYLEWNEHTKRENNTRIYRERIREVKLEKTSAYMLGTSNIRHVIASWEKPTYDVSEYVGKN